MEMELTMPDCGDQMTGERPEAFQEGHLPKPPCHDGVHEDGE